MKRDKEFWLGVLFIALLSIAAYLVASLQAIKELALSPLIIGIVLGMLWANTLGGKTPKSWSHGIKFCTKQLLRTGIVLYGFRLTLTEVMEVGLPAIVVDIIVIALTMLFGIAIGKILKMDSETTIMTSIGSSICGAAAVLGAEPVVKCPSHKTAVAVSTVVIFGIIAMFLYPIMYRAGVLDSLDSQQVAIYTGSTLHEVANVAGAGNAMDPTDALGIAGTATITKMIRVIMLAPVLIVLALFIKKPSAEGGKRKIAIPWFAFGFIGVILLTTLLTILLPMELLSRYIYGGGSYLGILDTFLLTMAMTALGVETTIEKFRQSGAKPFLLALLLFVWLVGGGYLLARYLVPILV